MTGRRDGETVTEAMRWRAMLAQLGVTPRRVIETGWIFRAGAYLLKACPDGFTFEYRDGSQLRVTETEIKVVNNEPKKAP